jgi:hypothetical protein
MTVRELIDILSEQHPDSRVNIELTWLEGRGWAPAVRVYESETNDWPQVVTISADEA